MSWSQDQGPGQHTSTIQYQRPFGWQSNPNLTDIRSTRMRLRSSMASSSSNSVSSNTTASSGVAGIGYVGGKAVKWVGLQILN